MQEPSENLFVPVRSWWSGLSPFGSREFPICLAQPKRNIQSSSFFPLMCCVPSHVEKLDQPTGKSDTTSNGGSLGSRVDEDRSKARQGVVNCRIQ